MESSWPSLAFPFSCAFSTGFELKGGLTLLKPTPSFLQRGKQVGESVPLQVTGSLWPFSECWVFSFFLFKPGWQTEAREFESLSQVRRHAQEPVLPVSPSAQKEKGFEETGRGVFSHPRFPNC